MSIFFQVDDNEEKNEVLKDFKIDSPGAIAVNMKQLFAEQIPEPIVYFSYKGSRSIPPCNEDINYYVIEKPLAMTTGQLAAFSRLWKNNQLFAKGNGNNRSI